MTFNIQHARNFITHEIDTHKMAETIRNENADIVVMQEVYGVYSDGSEGQSDAIASELGFNSFFAGALKLSKCIYGNALLSRYPIVSANTIPVPSDALRKPGRYFEDRCIIDAVVSTPEGELKIIGTHFGLQPEEAQSSVKKVCRILDTTDMPTVFLGDLNLHPDSKILDPIRHRLCDSDSFYVGNNFTYPSDKPNEKIDYIFVSGNITVKNVVIPRVIAADHLPVTVEISI